MKSKNDAKFQNKLHIWKWPFIQQLCRNFKWINYVCLMSYVCLILHPTVASCGLSMYLLPRLSYSSVTFMEDRVKIPQEHRPYSQSCKVALTMPLFPAQSSLLYISAWDTLLSSGMLYQPVLALPHYSMFWPQVIWGTFCSLKYELTLKIAWMSV